MNNLKQAASLNENHPQTALQAANPNSVTISDRVRQQQANDKQVILYLRLSREDGDKAESDSIQNQRRILADYAERNNLTPYIEIADDGHSGANWNRPGWNKLMEKVDSGRVSTIIVKNLDRLGRDYLRVGLFIEQAQMLNIRIIAVGDNIDTAEGEDDLLPFRALFAEWHARDTSRKIKAVIKNKGRSGKPLGTTPMYGFRNDPNDSDKRVIDEDSAAIVRRIFQMTVEGIGPYQIARILNEEKVERPSYYMHHAGIVKSPGKSNPDLPYNWRGNTVAQILTKREYMGDLVSFKSYKPTIDLF